MISSNVSLEKIERIIKSTRLLSRLYHGESSQYYYEMVCDYYSRIRDARKNGDYVAAHTMFLPIEIFHAMDILPLHLEYTAYMISLFTGSCNDVLTLAAEMGLAPEICSSHRLIGGILKTGSLLPLDSVVCGNLQCDNSIKSSELIMEYHHCPGFLFDYPYNQNQAGEKFIIQELTATIDFLEQNSGHKLDWDKLSANLSEINKQIDLVRRINETGKSTPSPIQPQDFLKFLAVDYMFAGIPELTLYLERMLAELTDMTAKGKGFANPERFRLMGLMIPPWHLQGTIDGILKEHNAAIVCYPNLCSWEKNVQLDPSQPLESIARKMALAPSMRMFGPINERALNPIRQGIREYKIDGAVNFTHIGCRQMGPSNKFFKDVLDEFEIPMLNIDCDLVDRTITSEDEVRGKMEQFFELLEDR